MGLRSTATILAASGPPGLLPAREQMAVSLGWHGKASRDSAVAAVVAGWGVGQYPDAGGSAEYRRGRGETALRSLLVVVAFAAVIALPAFGYLLRLTQSET